MGQNVSCWQGINFPFLYENDDDYNEVAMQVIEKRINLIEKLNLPHFYDSIANRFDKNIMSGYEKLSFLLKSRKNFSERDQEFLAKLKLYIGRMESEFGDVLKVK
ncbi:MAG: hypothetical protein LBS40_07380 [Burkholderiales bacterium]|nr:hypothetical protein [Burkholderiales bacterium]